MRRLGMVFLAILFLFMVFAGPAAPKTEAVVVSTVVIGAVIAAMAAAGIGLTVSGMTSAQLQDWVSGKLNDWATSLGGTVQDHIDGSDITVSGRGFLSIGNLAATSIVQFINWLKNEQGITNNVNIPVITGNAAELDYVNHDLTFDEFKQIAVPIAQYNSNNSNNLYYAMPCVTGVVIDTVYAVLCDRYNNGNVSLIVAFHSDSDQGNIKCYNALYRPEDSHWQSYDSFGGKYYDSSRHIVYCVGAIGNYNLYQSLFIPYYSSFVDAINAISAAAGGDNSALSIQTGIIEIPTINTGDKWFLDVGADPGVTVETATDGVIADTIEGTLTVSGEVAEEEPEIEIDGPIGISGLTEVFPFCIPFDVYDLLSCLSADPQTPIFTVRFVIPGIINEEFTIDLTPFNAVAQIVRTMELLGFAIGLALVTRERFLRS